MNSTAKLTDNKAIIALLAEQFPQCFSLKGEAKPLKIGLFQELSERLAEDERVSKTQLRGAIRHYTTSWRYLRCIKAGAKRVDLDGNLGDELTQEHIEHAQQTLAESQAKAKQREAAKKPAESTDKPRKAKPARAKVATKARSSKPAKATKVETGVKVEDVSALKIDQKVLVTVAKTPMNGTIVDIAKSDVKVQLTSGMVVKVKLDQILAKA
ncbi:RNA chaperone ProQ [Psychrobium sp. 1_MG-2023]|uniref:RNA chaperone ProQ n=1 Tax=Psychrobium sp. 1_MG-2023 TaxID=3062624 RepID=UPI000C349837|nr:RNA chaperone ProQ [Psychrobium sp. 1_MG-2023]MDP2560377.1 RNA chaperone ProQ [Psychrobium sp. 1_MG-2023]PKF55487.1 RNA chaperone ProQ [Alteromonadales bacterium alter-6D02]